MTYVSTTILVSPQVSYSCKVSQDLLAKQFVFMVYEFELALDYH
jgi:hypothetical protein